MLIIISTVQAQTPPTRTAEGNLECEIVLDIYDGFYDWVAGVSYSGSDSPKDVNQKFTPGAVTVANLNDTNGSGMGIGNNGVDATENQVLATANGRNEIDLMKLVVRKKDGTASLTGNVTLAKVSGAVRLWSTPSKGTEVNISSPLTIPTSQLPKTYYIEATAASGSLYDIEFSATYNGNDDRVRATAVWVEKTNHWIERVSTPIPQQAGPLKNVGNIVRFAILGDVAKDGSLYGFGEFWKKAVPWDSDGNKDKKIGGRILMEWRVFPSGAKDVASFDVTRQRKTRTWSIEYAQQVFTPSVQNNMNFPFEPDTEPADSGQGEDVEEPNDDSEGSFKYEDRIPIADYLYSWDAPSTFQTFDNNGVTEDGLAFRVSKNWFKEFVRVRAKCSPFNNYDATLQGSRASEKFDWHCIYYTNKDGEYEMAIDNENINYAFPKIYQGGVDVADQNLYSAEVQVTTGVNYEVGDFSLVYWGINSDGKKELWVTRIAEGPMIATEQEYFISATETIWNISIDGVNMVLEEQTNVDNDTFFLLSTFKTNANAKDNVLGTGSYTNYTR